MKWVIMIEIRVEKHQCYATSQQLASKVAQFPKMVIVNGTELLITTLSQVPLRDYW